MGRSVLILVGLLGAGSCNKPRLSVMPCDADLGYQGERMHLANIRFLQESKQFDWFELYDNIEDRRSMKPAADCIPVRTATTTERAIERQEYSLRNFR